MLGSLCNTVGFCVANWMNYAFFDDNGPFQWRFPLAFQLVFSAIVAVILPVTVESPRWLLMQGRLHEAQVVLARLRGTEHDLDDTKLNDELRSIQKALQDEQEARVSIGDTLLGRDSLRNLHRLVLRQVAYCNWHRAASTTISINILKLWNATDATVQRRECLKLLPPHPLDRIRRRIERICKIAGRSECQPLSRCRFYMSRPHRPSWTAKVRSCHVNPLFQIVFSNRLTSPRHHP